MLGVIWALAFDTTTLKAQVMSFPLLHRQFFVGSPGLDSPKRLLQATDSVLYVAGVTDDASGATDGFIAAITPSGRQLWKQTFGGVGYDEIRDVVISPNGQFIYFAGVSGSNLAHDDNTDLRFFADYWIGKATTKGELVWQKTLGGTNQDQAFTIALGKNETLLVGGSSWSQDLDASNNTGELNNGWYVLLSQDGMVLRNGSIGGNRNDMITTSTAMRDGSFLVAGYTNSNDRDHTIDPNKGDAFIARLDFAGNVNWFYLIPETYQNRINRIVATQYGYSVVVGQVFSPENGMQFWVLKIDDKGKVTGELKFGGPGFEELNSAVSLRDGGFAFIGTSFYTTLGQKFVKGGSDCWLIRTDADLNVQWQRTFGGPDYEAGVDLLELRNGVIYGLAQKMNPTDKTENNLDAWVFGIQEHPCTELNPYFVTDLQEVRERANTPIRFTNQTEHADEFLWDFGDNTTSDEVSPRKSYKRPGIYMVKLRASIGKGCSKTYIYPKPVIITE
jgi:hypothetical protein